MALRWKIFIVLVFLSTGFFYFLVRGIEFKNVEIKDLKEFPAGNSFKIQRLFIKIASADLGDIILEIENSRLFLPGADPVVLRGTYRDRELDLNVFARALSVRDIRRLFPEAYELEFLKGTVQDLDIFIAGKLKQPKFTGRFHIKELEYKGSLLTECEGSFQLSAEKPDDVRLLGSVVIEKGTLTAHKANIRLEESRVVFSGPVRSPYFKLRGNTQIDGVKIKIAVSGTRENPEVELSSEPPMPQEALLLMVATGQRWKGVEDSFDQRSLNPALTVDFVDYFLFGGSGRKMAQYFGISDVSLKVDKETKELTIKGEYKVTDQIFVGAQKEIQPDQSTGTAAAAAPQPLPDDKVYMKYKLKF